MKESWFFSCGAGFHQIPLIQAARGLGFRVAAADANTNALALKENYVDRHFHVSMTDWKGLLTAIDSDTEIRSGIAGIYARSYGRAVEVAHLAGRRLGLVSNPHSALRFFRNKACYKARLNQWDVPVPGSLKTDGPFIVRPSVGHAKEGILIVEARQGLASVPTEFFVEPLILGQECILLGFIVDGRFFPLVITDRFMHGDFTDRMHVFPSRLPPLTKYQMVEHCRRIVRRSGLRNGPFFAEFVVDEQDKPYLIECAPEVGGEFLADDLIPAVTGLSYFDLLVKIYTGTDLAAVQAILRDLPERPREKAMVIRYISSENRMHENETFAFSSSVFLDPGFYFARALPVSKPDSTRRNLKRPAVFALTANLNERDELMERAESIGKEMERK